MQTNLTKKLDLNSEFVSKLKIAIVRTDYYQELLDNMTNSAKETLVLNGILPENIEVFVAPGSWEIPVVAQHAAKSGKFDAIIALGIIVKGQTYHFEMIANECARAMMQLSLDYSMPVANEVLAVFDIEQAKARAGQNESNKGIEAATAVLKVLNSLNTFNSTTRQ